MKDISIKETSGGSKTIKLSPYARFRSFLKDRKTREEKKALQLKMAIMTGGITKVK
jgi:hypothetical protein